MVRDREDWPFAFICQGRESEVASTLYQWLSLRQVESLLFSDSVAGASVTKD